MDLEVSYQVGRQKIILVGDVAVGKTSMIQSILGLPFNEDYEPSIGVDYFSKTIKFKKRMLKFQIWDTGGQEKFRSLIPNYIHGASIVLLVYDITNDNSFSHLDEWVDFVNNIETTNIVIVGNKCDLENERKVTREMGENFAKEKDLRFFEVSAKDNMNIDLMFFNSIADLPLFSVINDENLSKEEIVNILEQENVDNSRVNNSEALFETNKTTEINLVESKSNRSQNENDVIQKNETMDEQILHPGNKKVKKCC